MFHKIYILPATLKYVIINSMEKFFCNAKRILLIGSLLAVVAVLCLCLFSPAVVASAENYSLGTKDPLNAITVYYGDQASYAPFHPNGMSIWVKFLHYVGTPDGSNVPIDLVDESNRFVVEPGLYFVTVYGNVTPCDQNGVSTEDTCTGVLILNVLPKTLSVCFEADALVKGFGETVAADVEDNLPWSFLHPEEEDSAITLRFASDGFASTASVGNYPIAAKPKVFLDHVDRSEYYEVLMSVKDSEDPVVFTVTPKDVLFTYDKNLSLPFNDYLTDGKVDTMSQVMENGDMITVLFRLEEPPQNGVLTVDADYKLEYYGYTVTPDGGEAAFYESGVSSDYSVTVNFQTDTITATRGTLVIYADESKRAERESQPKYLYMPLSLQYTDVIVNDKKASFRSEYYGAQLTLNCKVQGVASGAIPCGVYSMTFDSFDCDLLVKDESAVTFEGGTLPLTITPRVLVYDEESTVEYGAGAVYEQPIELQFEDTIVGFTLSAEVGNAAVGSELSYASALSDNANFTLSFDQAKLRVVKRHTGVSVIAETQSAYYGCLPERFAVLWLDYGTANEQALSSEFSYSYKANASAPSYEGLPSEVGSYLVTCTVQSDRYEAEPLTIPLAINKRPVLAVLSLSKAEKVYHTTFAFISSGNNRTVQLLKLYAYDKTKDEQGEEIEFTSGDFGGTILSSDGAAAEATVGEYEFDCSGAISPKYVIEKAVVKVGTQEVQNFSVVKAPAPAAPVLEPKIEDREIKVTATERMELQISTSEDFSSRTVKRGKELSYTAPVYGQIYYLRMCVSDDVNYEENGAWATTTCYVPYLAPNVKIDDTASTSSSLTFSSTMPMAAQSVAGYVLKYRVGSSGAWQEGNVITGLSANTTYKIFFRYERGEVIGKEAEIGAATLRAPVEEKKIKYSYDRETGELSLSVDVSATLEYMLCSSSGEQLTEWVSAEELPELEADSEYLLRVRVAASGSAKPSDIQEIKVDTHKAKEPLTFKKVFFDWFLAIVGGIVLITTVILLVAFVKSKRKTDREELGGKKA